MPWSDCEYGRAICDGCSAASKAADLTGRQTLHLTGAYVPRRSGTDVIYCPMCIMTNDEAFGGKTSHQMSWAKACKFMESHWHTPAEALELGHTGGHPDLPQPAGQHHQNHQSQQVPPGMIQAAARPEPPETPVGQRDQNHPSQQVPPGTIQGEALTPALAIRDVSGRVEQSPLAVMVEDLKEEVDTLKAVIETLQNEVRALKEQVSGQPSQSSSVP